MNSADFKDFLISQELVLLRHNFHFICRKIYIYLNYPIIFVHPIIKEVHKGKTKKKKQKDEDCCLTQNVMLSFLVSKDKGSLIITHDSRMLATALGILWDLWAFSLSSCTLNEK